MIVEHDNVPVNTPFNIRTYTDAVAADNAVGEVDFSNSAKLTNVSFLIDNLPVSELRRRDQLPRRSQ